MDDRRPFRGADARRELAWTAEQLRGPRVQPLFRGVFVAAGVEVDLPMRARGALLVHPNGVVGGVAAGAVWGSAYGTVDAVVDVHVTVTGARSQRGLRAVRSALRHDEATVVDGVRVTTPLRTALDLARRLPLVEAVAALDALCRVAPVRPADLVTAVGERPGERGNRAVGRVVELADPRARTPMWSRARLALALRGITVPEVSLWVPDSGGAPATCCELAWPEERYGVTDVHRGPPVAIPEPAGWHVERVDVAAAVEHAERFATGVARGLLAARHRGAGRG